MGLLELMDVDRMYVLPQQTPELEVDQEAGEAIRALVCADTESKVRDALLRCNAWSYADKDLPDGRLGISATRNLLTNLCAVTVLRGTAVGLRDDAAAAVFPWALAVRCTCGVFARHGACPHVPRLGSIGKGW